MSAKTRARLGKMVSRAFEGIHTVSSRPLLLGEQAPPWKMLSVSAPLLSLSGTR